MPANRKPVETMERSGAYAKNPKRRRPLPPKSNQPIGDPPSWLTAEEVTFWDQLVFDIPEGVLTAADKYILALTVQLLNKTATGQITGPERTQLISALARLGLTPADRSRISPVTIQKNEDEFKEFA